MLLLDALYTIATRGYTQYTTEQYFAIPDNGIQLMDLVIQEMQVPVNGIWYPIDLGIRRREVENKAGYSFAGSVEDLGDMQVFFGLETLDATGLQYKEGKVFPTPFESVKEVSVEKAMELLGQGYLAIQVKKDTAKALHGLPLVVLKSATTYSGGWTTGASPNFFLTKDGKYEYALVNGYLIDLDRIPKEKFRNRIY